MGRIVALLAEAKEDADEDLANQLFALSMSSTMTATANPKAASKALSSLHEAWARLDERRSRQLWNAIATDVRIGIELHRIVSAEDAKMPSTGRMANRAIACIPSSGRCRRPRRLQLGRERQRPQPSHRPGAPASRLHRLGLRKALAPFATEA